LRRVFFFALLASLAGVLHAGPSDQLKELRGRIDRLQRQLSESEETRTEASDALRESERAISDANRRLFELAGQQREVKGTLGHLEARKSQVMESVEAQQALLAKLLYQQYLAGQPEPLRLVLNRQNPNEIAREMLTCPRGSDRIAAPRFYRPRPVDDPDAGQIAGAREAAS